MYIARTGDLQGIIDVIPNPVFVKNRDHEIILLNEGACRLFGHSREVMLASTDFDLFPAEQAATFHAADDRVFASGALDATEEQMTDAQGSVRTLITHKKRVVIGDEDFIVAVVTDITDYREAEARNRYLAIHDVLTGLPNRLLLNQRIEHELLRQQRDQKSGAALIYVDLDRFKQVNDTLGHQAGDDLLRQFSDRLGSIVRASDTVCRLGGDEFAILLHDATADYNAQDVCKRILAVAAQPFALQEGQAHVGASLGIADVSCAEISQIELHRRADVALYQAKRDGRGCYREFSVELDHELRDRRELEIDLRCALAAGDQLTIDYQPLFSAEDSRVVAFEALVRWQHPRRGLLCPADFLDVAEESGLIVPLGDWVFERACTTLKAWPDVGLAVNVSPGQLRSDGLAERLLGVLTRVGFPASRMQLEITEHAILDADEAVGILKRLRDAGMQVVLDDFGTGYSSLSHLQKIEIDKVKIDRSFVHEMGTSRGSAAIIQAVATLGGSIGIVVTAEGIETEEQRSSLRALGCEELQGYLLSRPLSEQDMVSFLERSRQEAEAA